MPEPEKRRVLLSSERAELEAHEANVTWAPFFEFVQGDEPKVLPDGQPNPEWNPDRPYSPQNSLVDAARQGSFIGLHSEQWSGGVRFEASDGTNQVEFMLDALQARKLAEAMRRWCAGTLKDWLEDGSPVE